MKRFVSWLQVTKFVKEVVEEYSDKNITGVYGLPRGGLVFAVMLSHRLNIPMLQSPVSGCLIVDDICDTGESLLHYVKNSSGEEDKPDSHIVTMYYKENELGIVPEMWAYNKEKDWIVFPWEQDEPEQGLFS